MINTDNETGESQYNLHLCRNVETGEEEYLAYCLDKETGEKQYCSLDRICESFEMPNPFKVSRYTTQLTAIVRHENSKYKSSEKRMEFITAIVFLIPTFIIFTPLLGLLILSLDIVLHRWCHLQNSKKGLRKDEGLFYYQSPLHMLYKEFCSKCSAEEAGRKIHKIQSIRYNKKRSTMQESLRRVVA
ncbi:uncharacterized protein LOC126740373 [Anthonomus grandis grandis]|uniref:uncharacterized protein LOC126740373 n=1 Tax=Anthonomus grandis grandis TaxID=2921223 RepID=UPI002165463D|nr:uncharacterized protein LOC126740373 [Anthonomus grandis grandis]XP_050302317.1 uncharacterized protein LOC126740373 [Anthonomus grandis grandis]XP_050302326.1 uncharacterized protein LOC126740373 [Anthonomus grandis grandis]XP_050302334.1 uncharacterized protein LOC126740373 [Anthonomus grandis grandis]